MGSRQLSLVSYYLNDMIINFGGREQTNKITNCILKGKHCLLKANELAHISYRQLKMRKLEQLCNINMWKPDFTAGAPEG